jgi:hypothetical protein
LKAVYEKSLNLVANRLIDSSSFLIYLSHYSVFMQENGSE